MSAATFAMPLHMRRRTRLHHLAELERALRAVRVRRVPAFRRHVVHRVIAAHGPVVVVSDNICQLATQYNLT